MTRWRRRGRKRLLVVVPLYAALGLFALFAAFPLFWLFSSAIRPAAELFVTPPQLVSPHLTLAAFHKILRYTAFLSYLKSSLIAAVGATILGVTVAALGAYSLSRHEYPAKNAIARLILLTYMFPSILLVVPLFVVISRVGLADTYTGLILTYTTFALPFGLWLLRSYFLTIPREIDDAARIDGANEWQVFRRVILPLSLPGIATTAVFSFIHAWNEFLYALVLISSADKKTLPVGLYGFIGGEMQEWDSLLASATMFLVPTLFFFLMVQRNIVKGLTAGATKG